MTSAVVTGSSGGIGAAVAAALIHEGYRVIGFDLEDPAGSHSWKHVEVDLGEAEALKKAVRDLPNDTGVIVHAAAHQPIASAQSLNDEVWLRAWRVNVMSLQILVAHLFPILRENTPQRVINIGSIHGSVTSRTMAPYAVTKAAQSAYIRSLALDASTAGVTAIDIELGATASPKLFEGLVRHRQPASVLSNLVGRLPAGRLVDPQDVACLVRWLMEPAADHLTGSSLAFSGGIRSALASEWGIERND
jgi:NAD(P)-dependent dehydrogenase (short-subunit alcohol dehydrogenase family)